MEYTTLLWLFSLCSSEIQANTHWMVTETGLIQPRVDSPFEMARPYDLLAFLNQDTRWDNILKLFNDLSKRQTDINKLWVQLERDTDITKLIESDDNCRKSGPLNSLDYYGAHLEDGLSKHIEQEEYLLYDPSFGEDTDVPDCKKISSLTFSMAAFEHLESMISRDNLSAIAELSLPELISPIMNVEQFGHWVATILRRNSSSWLHYNMASLYWRVRGNAPKALECSRRAVHYAPRDYKSIALLSMGTILHRCKRQDDAAIILEAAVDHDPQCAQGHFVLGNVYAVLGDYNITIKHYDECLKIDSVFQQAKNNKLGVKCIQRLMKKMAVVHRSLKKLKEQLAEYAAREALWLKSQAAFLRTMKHNEEFDYRKVEKIVTKMSEITGLKIKELKKEGDKNSLMQYFLNGPLYNPKWAKGKGIHAVDTAYALQKLVKHIGKHANTASDFVIQPDLIKVTDGKLIKEIGPMPVFPDVLRGKINTENLKAEHKIIDKAAAKTDELIYEYELAMPLYPAGMKVPRGTQDFDLEAEWPTDNVCKRSGSAVPPNVEVIYPVFMPFENKGLRLNGLLTDKIGVSVNAEHELPWHPPACPNNKEANAFTQKKAQRQSPMNDVVPTDFMRRKLMEYVGDGNAERVSHMQDAEIGQRIYSAMQSDVAPKWLLYTMSSLYWRVRGNNANALSCLMTASKTVRGKYRDLVMSSLASVYLEMGFVDEAQTAIEDAYKYNSYEPVTNFIIATINMIKKDRNTQLTHLKMVLRIDENFLGGLARTMLVGWSCVLKQVLTLRGMAEWGERDALCKVGIGNQCDVVQDKFSGCQMSGPDMKCIVHRERDSTSTIVRLMEIKEQSVQSEEMEDNMFDAFIVNMPLERTDKQQHEKNFELMIRTIDKLRGCGPKGCSNITPEDLALKEDDCSYQFLQIGYWMHIISFRQVIDDNDLRLPAEIASYPPSTKSKYPECRAYMDPSQDFFLEKLYMVDIDGWEPLLSLMQQFVEVFDYTDYSILGLKITKLVESKGRWWAGALGAGWWCGAGGRGGCALRCLAAAYALAPDAERVHAVRALATLLHLQNKTDDGKLMAQLSFYMSPKSNTEAFLVAASHTYHGEYEQAVWMYRYALTFDEKYLPAKACLHATMCTLLFKDKAKPQDIL